MELLSTKVDVKSGSLWSENSLLVVKINKHKSTYILHNICILSSLLYFEYSNNLKSEYKCNKLLKIQM
jgi:hypothetical protein